MSARLGWQRGVVAWRIACLHLVQAGYAVHIFKTHVQAEHSHIDGYWNTNEFCSFAIAQGASLASIGADGHRTFYCDAYHHLRYLAWKPCEVTKCDNMHANLR
ncbi:hypothetical protein [Hymenobacter sp. BT559]|uniref:hypothetical protein n=1 Tax=Hymenobacter sp. BT559 TaxID=2795729 RepID=UPI0018EB0087|nr:hypothetical protein [Hymenobacter sp. BT559]MBJ6145554.1 hypothetical protein [Hymenobacter sp. BT559]